MALAHLLNQTVSVINPGGSLNRHGDPTFTGPGVEYRARFERTHKSISTEERDRAPIHGVAIVGPTADISNGAQLTYDGTKYKVVERSEAIGRSGNVHHIELMCQLWSYAA